MRSGSNFLMSTHHHNSVRNLRSHNCSSFQTKPCGRECRRISQWNCGRNSDRNIQEPPTYLVDWQTICVLVADLATGNIADIKQYVNLTGISDRQQIELSEILTPPDVGQKLRGFGLINSSQVNPRELCLLPTSTIQSSPRRESVKRWTFHLSLAVEHYGVCLLYTSPSPRDS